jgi:protein-disulfide isomerase
VRVLRVLTAMLGVAALAFAVMTLQEILTPTRGFSARATNLQAPSILNGSAHIGGTDGAKLVLVEFGDYECPACRNSVPVLSKLEHKFGRDIDIRFRSYPLVSIHPDADAAGKAAVVSAAFGKFSDMHRLLMGGLIDSDAINQYLSELHIPRDRFADLAKAPPGPFCVSRSEAHRLSITRTPTFFLVRGNREVIQLESLYALYDYGLDFSGRAEGGPS